MAMILALPVLILLVVGIVLLVKAIRRRPGVLLAVAVACIAVVLALGFLVVARVQNHTVTPARVGESRVEPVRSATPASRAGGPEAAPDIASAPEDTAYPDGPSSGEPGLADVYPSAELAARALADIQAARIEAEPRGGPETSADKPAKIKVRVIGNNSGSLLQAVADELRKHLISADVIVGDVPPASGPADEQLCTVYMSGSLDASGAVDLSLPRPGRAESSTVRANYINKDWAANPSLSISEDCGRHIIATSSWLATPEEARQDAFRNAAGQLALRVNPVLSQLSPQRPSGPGDDSLRAMLLGEMERGLVKEEFIQRVHRPYGDVWQQSVLVGANENDINRLARQAAATAQASLQDQRSTWVTQVLSLLGLAVLVLGVYGLMNAATKGYYVWTLRVVAALGLIGAIVLVAALA